MSHFPDTYRRPFIVSLAIALVLLAGSLGVTKSAYAAAPEHPPAAVERVAPPAPEPERIVHAEATPIRHHFAELEVDSGEVRSAIETARLANARPSEIGPGRLVAARAGCGRHETPGT